MIHPMDLTGKKILVITLLTTLDQVIIERINSLGGIATILNFSTTELIEEEVMTLVKKQGKFDGIVFTIVHSDFKPLQFVKPDNVRVIMNDNYGAFIEVMRSLKKAKGLNDGASVVALSSISSVRAMKAKMAFCASKAALDAAIRCLAVELADKGIRINSVQKGAVDVDTEKSHIQDVISIRDSENTTKQPLGVCKAEEIANAVTFLLSDAVKTMTGTSLVIDGGYLA